MIALNKKKLQRIVNNITKMWKLSAVGYYTCYMNFYGWNDKIVVKLSITTDAVLSSINVLCYNFNTSQQYYEETITHSIKSEQTVDWDEIEYYINKSIKEHNKEE